MILSSARSAADAIISPKMCHDRAMGKGGEQIDNYGPRARIPRGRVEKTAKRIVKRQRRRAEKRDPENAPTKTPYRGWTT